MEKCRIAVLVDHDGRFLNVLSKDSDLDVCMMETRPLGTLRNGGQQETYQVRSLWSMVCDYEHFIR